MKQIIVLALCAVMALACGCGTVTAVTAEAELSASPTAIPTSAPEPTLTPEPTPTPEPTATPTPSPTPTPDPAVWGCVEYNGHAYWLRVIEVGTNERGKVLISYEIRDFGSVSYVGGEPQYPVRLKVVTEKKTFPWVSAVDVDAGISCLFNTDLTPLYIIAYPADAPDDQEGWIYFDPVTLQITQAPASEGD